MAGGVHHRGQAARWIGLAGLLLGATLAGCNNKSTPGGGETTKPPMQVGGATGGVPPHPVTLDPRLHQSFADATLPIPPAGVLLPPDLTMTNKSTGKLYTEVMKMWDSIHFTSDRGKPLAYRAVVDTQVGTFEIGLRPDLAPNHVRSFVALARVGYYDGLVFERTAHDEGGDAGSRLELIEGGCPLGTGEMGYGSIGYWLKPEVSDKTAHEEGTVGAWRSSEDDADACKFYITLSPAPFMNGHYTIFGKVTQGLDVARKILTLPVRSDAPEGDKPLNPVVIQKVTIEATEVEKAPGA